MRPRRSKKPILSRYFSVAILIALTSQPHTARARQGVPTEARALDEKQAVRRALDNPGLSELLRGSSARADAAVRSAGRWPNPRLSYNREQVLGNQANGEDYLSLSQTLSFSGERWLDRKAARTRSHAQDLRNQATRADVAAQARHAYAHTLRAQVRLDLLQRWRERVARSVEAARHRVEAGDAPRLHVERVQQELQILDATVARARAAHIEAWSALRALMSGDSPATPPRLAGPLAPAGSRPAGSLAESPTLQALQTEQASARIQQRAARRAAIPPLTVSLGYKGVDPAMGGRQNGFTAGASVPIPLGDRGQVERRQAQADLATARGQTTLAHRQLEAREAELLALRNVFATNTDRSDPGNLADLADAA